MIITEQTYSSYKSTISSKQIHKLPWCFTLRVCEARVYDLAHDETALFLEAAQLLPKASIHILGEAKVTGEGGGTLYCTFLHGWYDSLLCFATRLTSINLRFCHTECFAGYFA